MRREIAIDALLAPIPGDNPGGEDVRYTQAYEDIKEARKFDEALDLGDWKREVRTAC
jgi:type VI secretion system protein ImpA